VATILVLNGRRLRPAILLVASAIFALVGVLVFAVAPGGRVGGVVVFLFFGGCAAVAILQLVLGSQLTLTAEGFTVRSLGRQVTRRWQDVESFVVVRASAFTNIVGIRLLAAPGGDTFLTRAARNVFGYQGALPDTYGMKANDLAALMNEWLSRYGRAGP
jgi:hypothetical protein